MSNIPAGVRLVGKIGPIPLPDEFTLSRVNGNRYTVAYRGLQKDVLGKLPALVKATEIQYQPDRDGPLATIRGTFNSPTPFDGTPEVAQEQLTLSFNKTTLSIFSNTLYSTISDAEAAYITDVVQNLKPTSSDTPATFATTVAKELAKLANDNERNAMNELLRGGDSFVWFQPVIVYTRTASLEYGGTLGVSRVGKVVTSTWLSNYLNAKVLFYQISAAIGNVAASPNKNLGWLCDARLDLDSLGRALLIETFEYGAYSAASYPLA